MVWNGNNIVFKGYATGEGKNPTMKVKGVKLLSWEQVEGNKSFGAILNKDFVDISFDSDELSQKFWYMAEKNDWNCLILENPTNGHIHSYWKDTHHRIEKGGKDKKLAVGLIADIHSGATYIPLKVDGVERFPPSFEPDYIDEVPDELLPVNTQIDLLNLSEGSGRNDDLFKYILILQSQLSVEKEGIRRILNNINHFIFQDALSDEEVDVIARDESFAKPIFYKGKTFLHNNFGQYLKNEYHVIRLNGQLHVYDNGIYKSGYRFIESKMIEVIPTLKATQRSETLKFLEIITPDDVAQSDANLIAFRNGVYDLETDELKPFSPEYIITNMIPWDYNPEAYSELCDHTLDKMSCFDKEIRAVLEESIGYCFFRQNELSKSFILTGTGSNGKSTFLDMVKNVLGRPNYVSLDMDELSERFSVSSMFGKLANIGDDSNDEFLQGKALSQFKRLVSGNDMKGENKGQDVFFFKPMTKLFFSFNEIPRMRNRGFDAIKRRLVIIPFNAKFSKEDPDFDAGITWKLKKQDVAEYLIMLGIQGLKRVLENQGFTESKKVRDKVDQFEKDNNPILLFLEEIDESEILNHETKEVFARYDVFCNDNGFTRIAMQTFTKEIKKNLKCDRKVIRINGKKSTIFVR
ncbi:MAG: phage/plasmid primase, P4 family [Eubacteriales bacterium]|nr:phage/plasmid primase, P4 family [Eubacteriales bacterium]